MLVRKEVLFTETIFFLSSKDLRQKGNPITSRVEDEKRDGSEGEYETTGTSSTLLGLRWLFC